MEKYVSRRTSRGCPRRPAAIVTVRVCIADAPGQSRLGAAARRRGYRLQLQRSRRAWRRPGWRRRRQGGGPVTAPELYTAIMEARGTISLSKDDALSYECPKRLARLVE